MVEGESPNLKCTNLFWWLNPINPIWFEMPDSIKIILNLIRLKYRCLICICLIVIFMIIVTFMRAVTTLVVVISHLVIDFHFLNYEIKHKCILLSILKSMIIFCKIKRRKCRPKCFKGFVFYFISFYLDSFSCISFIQMVEM